MPFPEQDPPTFEPMEYPSAADLNLIRDWLDAFRNETFITAEHNFSDSRDDYEYGPLDDEAGPEVTFIAGPDGRVLLYIYAHLATDSEGDNAFASYEIERVADNEIVVEAGDPRSIRSRSWMTESAQHVWREELIPGEEYVARMMFRGSDNGDNEGRPMASTYRKLIVDRVFVP